MKLSGLAILTINSTKNHETFKSKVEVYLVFWCNWRGVGRKGRKRGRRLWGNFPLELFVRITFPFPFLLVKWYLPTISNILMNTFAIIPILNIILFRLSNLNSMACSLGESSQEFLCLFWFSTGSMFRCASTLSLRLVHTVP